MNDLKYWIEQHYSITVLEIFKIEEGIANENYKISAQEGEYVLKIYHRVPSEVHFELDVLSFLEKKEFTSPKIIENRDGEKMSIYYDQAAVLFGFIYGKKQENYDIPYLRELGKKQAQLHVLLSDLEVPHAKRSWEPQDIALLVESAKESIVQRNVAEANEIYELIQKGLQEVLPAPELPGGIVHHDVKPENILRDDQGELWVLDFDNSSSGVWLYDLLTPLLWAALEKDTFNEEKVQAYLQGYESNRRLIEAEKQYFFSALQFRLLREVFIWLSLYDTEYAYAKCQKFLQAYLQVKSKNYSL